MRKGLGKEAPPTKEREAFAAAAHEISDVERLAARNHGRAFATRGRSLLSVVNS